MELFNNTNSGATFNEDRTHRLCLWRIWDESKPFLQLIGLNPSTANETAPDPTIRRIIQLAKFNGYGGIYMTNLFTVISANPDILENYNGHSSWLYDRDILLSVKLKCKDVAFVWGNFKVARNRAADCIWEFSHCNALCFGRNKNGSPKHPLYLKGNTKLIKY